MIGIDTGLGQRNVLETSLRYDSVEVGKMQEEWQNVGWQLLEVSLGQVRTHGQQLRGSSQPLFQVSRTSR